MALTVEDGTQVAAAESYVSAADCTTYHTNNGNAAWTGTDAVKEAALRKACRYLDGEYRKRWKGQKVYPTTQALEWPRAGVMVLDEPIDLGVSDIYYGVLEITTIPQRLKDAQCELALLVLAGELAPAVDGSIRREKIDVLETEYAPGVRPGKKLYPVVDQLLSDYLKPSGSSDALRG